MTSPPACRSTRSIKIELQGHTDSTGPADYNLGLSQRRAESVRDYLVSRACDVERMTAKGYGMTQPVADQQDEGRDAPVIAVSSCMRPKIPAT